MSKVIAKPPADSGAAGHRRIIRFAAYSVTSVLAVLMLTAAMPPIVADQSDRAILDAPVILLTSPISGEVSALPVSAGDGMEEGATASEVVNSRVDRTTLMTLEGKMADARQALDAARSKRISDLSYIQALDQQIAAQKAQLLKQFESQSTELQGELASSEALVAEKNALRDRQVNLVSRNVSDPYMLKPTTQQLSSAQGMRMSASAKLAANAAQVAAIKQDVFAGDNLVGIATLAQKRRDLSFDAERQRIEQTEATASLLAAMTLVDGERERVGRMAKAVLTAPSSGDILHVGVSLGRHVNAGDALVNLVDCKSLFAVAIFSYRQATKLSVGTPVTVALEGEGHPVKGTVSEIIPKSSDATDALYALPFPQTERREMFVRVKLDNPAALHAAGQGSSACPVGQWVTVTRQDGWVPSSSVIWHKASGVVLSMLRNVFAPSATAHQRARS